MEPSQPNQGAPAERRSRGVLDDVPNNNTEVAAVEQSKVPIRYANPTGASISTLPSPGSDLHYRLQHRNIAPAPPGSDQHDHPLTPPRHNRDDAYSQLHQWYSQNQRVAPAPPQAQQIQPHYVSPFAPPGHDIPTSSFPQSQYTASGAPPRLHPSVNLLDSSPPQPRVNRPPPPSLPPASPSIQQWPTRNLTVDEKTRKRQENYRQKGEAKRRQSFSSQGTVASQYVAAPTSASTPRKKRKSALNNTLVSPTPPPPLRYGNPYQQQPFVPSYHTQPPQQTNTHMPWAGPQQYQSPYPGPNDFPYHPQYQYPSMLMQPPAPAPPPPKPVDPESLPQPITSNYEFYKWPVKLYEVTATLKQRTDYAQTLIETVMAASIHPFPSFRWHAHTSTGFIEGGNRHSVILLQNAANPFTWGIEPVTSSTSIGVYGYGRKGEGEIRWTTIAPAVRLDSHLEFKRKWTPDMSARERRFHKAYWMACNMLPLGGLLNQGPMTPERVQDVDEEDGDFKIEEGDLQNSLEGEEVDEDKAAKVWQELMDEVEGLTMEQLGSEYTDIGGSERVHTAGD